MLTRFVSLFVLVASTLTLAACGSRDCVDLCEEGQEGNCTAIAGNCTDFCDALDAVQDDAGCGSDSDAYQECLDSESAVCDADCDREENDLASCVASYCISHPDDDNCLTLVASYDH